ncbi:hypothetical protein COY52_12555 [Candidatus Desantisbacteria bacterium CG_4_10_14_0_8_um_filter_48_22]|uniref:Mechanosensitive ion channel MscS domain-containing protein n=1 Tax=Candidatus Desantisbacteria bacterium CG_4_10_14_0_8_um_filter_48_22 TaxID=1974543 RepID=A0A2M7S4H8_9BACT|nr:MAG: hypothetical protein COS16_07765 [Candidatus Desantisbacteria bacterium CG02_land_8_20_14_3_00_49_13]PIZ14475.1 MAG: hypothetical protein COY52_12555 [Candidatus Desantisbacteria bacterium CG_4_10_14_0_8_um_filter_48_22]
MEEMTSALSQYTWRVITAIVIVLVGVVIARLLSVFINNILKRTDMPPATRGFLAGSISFVIIIIAVIMALTRFEIDIIPLVVGLAIIGFVVGLATQGALSNFVAGMMILAQRPFQTGDQVEVYGETGEVKEIKITSTIIDTPDNVRIIFPNAKLLAGEIKNLSTHKIRRISIPVQVNSGKDFAKISDSILAVFRSDARILKEPPTGVVVSSATGDKLTVSARAWCQTDEVEAVVSDMTVKIRELVDKS